MIERYVQSLGGSVVDGIIVSPDVRSIGLFLLNVSKHIIIYTNEVKFITFSDAYTIRSGVRGPIIAELRKTNRWKIVRNHLPVIGKAEVRSDGRVLASMLIKELMVPSTRSMINAILTALGSSEKNELEGTIQQSTNQASRANRRWSMEGPHIVIQMAKPSTE